MARRRTQKAVASRIDATYVRRTHRWRRMRMTAAFAASALAIIFVALATFGGRGQLIQNPGRLTSVHAKSQNNCALCHDGCDAQGKPTSRFSKAVSDTACLKCHDAAIHHENQSTFVILDTSRKPPERRSTNCASCHVEHRGQSALVSTDDQMCVQCHFDLSGKTLRPSAPEVPQKVTKFTLADHPGFGRSLKVAGKLTDPTNLRFNHQFHITGDGKNKPAIGEDKKEMRNCVFCHDPSPAAAQNLVWETGKTAFSMPGGEKPGNVPQPLIDGTGGHRSLTQVNFEKNCKVCHDLGTFPDSNVVIPHGNMGEVRQAILAYVTDSSSPWLKSLDPPSNDAETVNQRMVAKLGDVTSMPDLAEKENADKRKRDVQAVDDALGVSALSTTTPLDYAAKLPQDLVDKLLTAAGKMSASLVPAKNKAAVLSAIGSTTQPAPQLRPLVIANLQKEALRGVSGAAKKTRQLQFDAAFARFNQESPDPRLLEIYVAYENGKVSCIKCHDMQGNPSTVPPEWSALSLSKPAGAAADAAASPTAAKAPAVPAADVGVFATKSTGIPAGPRRWYVNSVFDHDAHRSMSCLECHSSALTSTKTSDLLLPDMQWQETIRKADGTTTTNERSCVECHHPDDSTGPGAASNCTECHTYHDRSHEQLPKPADIPPMAMSH